MTISERTSGKRRGVLVVLSGPSGVGKTTIARALLERPEVAVRRSVSATTREPRAGERNGEDYYFLSQADFLAAVERGEFLEWAKVHGHYYGTPMGPVREQVDQGVSVVLVIDVQGGLQVRDRWPDALLVWIDPPGFDRLETRLRSRGTDDEATIRRRLERAREEREVALRDYPTKYHVRNEDGREGEAVDALVNILLQQGCGG
jgi:guanylate kinase